MTSRELRQLEARMERKPEETALYWHCLQCGAHDPVEPTGGTEQDQYALGDHEPCITCGDGTAHVVTLRMGACYEQGLALGMDIRDAWERALQLRGGK